MADNNPVAVVRDVDSSPQHTRQVHVIAGKVAGGASATVTVETKCKKVLSAFIINETDAAVVAPTIEASTVTVGTEKVSFNVVNAKNYSYMIVALFSRGLTVDTISGTTTITYEPLRGN